jgi:SAM-dependent methyltransferase
LSQTVTGERVVTSRGGFNSSWQRHVACYALCEPYLGHGRIADIGCGIGHSYHLLAPRETVGIDTDPGVLEGQDRETVVADMRRLPFPDGEFDGAIAVHSIEHVPDPECALAETVRVLKPGATAALVTPNRLTFARPDEIIDPYHYVEFDPSELSRMQSLLRIGEDRRSLRLRTPPGACVARTGKARPATAKGPPASQATPAANDPAATLRLASQARAGQPRS